MHDDASRPPSAGPSGTVTRSAHRAHRARGTRPVPWPWFAVAGITFAFLVLPLVGLLGQVPWSTLGSDLSTTEATSALRLSLVCSVWAAALAVCFGVPLAWVLARVEFPGRSVLRALVLLPMVLPPVVGGVGLFYALGRDGLVGRYLYEWFDIQLTFSTAGAVIAETFVALPFLVITVEAALRSMDRRYEEAAATLGATPWTVTRRVTLPMILPGLVAGTALAWARALGEFGATITFAGNVAGRTQTTPLAVYLLLESRPEVAIGLSVVLLAVCIGVLALLRDRWFGVG